MADRAGGEWCSGLCRKERGLSCSGVRERAVAPAEWLSDQYGPMIPPIAREAGAGSAVFVSSTSRYFSPEPVLNRTTVSSGLKKQLSSSFWYATREAAPSGAAKMPSVVAQ